MVNVVNAAQGITQGGLSLADLITNIGNLNTLLGNVTLNQAGTDLINNAVQAQYGVSYTDLVNVVNAAQGITQGGLSLADLITNIGNLNTLLGNVTLNQAGTDLINNAVQAQYGVSYTDLVNVVNAAQGITQGGLSLADLITNIGNLNTLLGNVTLNQAGTDLINNAVQAQYGVSYSDLVNVVNAAQGITQGGLSLADLITNIGNLNTLLGNVTLNQAGTDLINNAVQAQYGVSYSDLVNVVNAAQGITQGGLSLADLITNIGNLNTLLGNVTLNQAGTDLINNAVQAQYGVSYTDLVNVVNAAQGITQGGLSLADLITNIGNLNTLLGNVTLNQAGTDLINNAVQAQYGVSYSDLVNVVNAAQGITQGGLSLADLITNIGNLNTLLGNVTLNQAGTDLINNAVQAQYGVSYTDLVNVVNAAQGITQGGLSLADLITNIGNLNTLLGNVTLNQAGTDLINNAVQAQYGVSYTDLVNVVNAAQGITQGGLSLADLITNIGNLNTLLGNVTLNQAGTDLINNAVQAQYGVSYTDLVNVVNAAQGITQGGLSLADLITNIGNLNTLLGNVTLNQAGTDLINNAVQAQYGVSYTDLVNVVNAAQGITQGGLSLADLITNIGNLNTLLGNVTLNQAGTDLINNAVQAQYGVSYSDLVNVVNAAQGITQGGLSLADLITNIGNLNTLLGNVTLNQAGTDLINNAVQAQYGVSYTDLVNVVNAAQGITQGGLSLADLITNIGNLNTLLGNVTLNQAGTDLINNAVQAQYGVSYSDLVNVVNAAQGITQGGLSLADLITNIGNLNTLLGNVTLNQAGTDLINNAVQAQYGVSYSDLVNVVNAAQGITQGGLSLADLITNIGNLNTLLGNVTLNQAGTDLINNAVRTQYGISYSELVSAVGAVNTMNNSSSTLEQIQSAIASLQGLTMIPSVINGQIGMGVDLAAVAGMIPSLIDMREAIANNDYTSLAQAVAGLDSTSYNQLTPQYQGLFNGAVSPGTSVANLVTAVNSMEMALNSNSTALQVQGALQNVGSFIQMGTVPQSIFTAMLGVNDMNGFNALITAVGNADTALNTNNGAANIANALTDIQQIINGFVPGSQAAQLLYGLLGVSGAAQLTTLTNTIQSIAQVLDPANNGPANIHQALINIENNYSSFNSSTIANGLLNGLLGVNDAQGLNDLLVVMNSAVNIQTEMQNSQSAWNLTIIQDAVNVIEGYTGSSYILNNYLNNLLNQYNGYQPFRDVTLPQLIAAQQVTQQAAGDQIDAFDLYGITPTDYNSRTANNSPFAEELETAIAPLGEGTITPAAAETIIAQIAGAENIDVFAENINDILMQQLIPLGISPNEIDQIARGLQALHGVLVARMQNQDVSQQDARQMVDIIMNAVNMQGVSETQRQQIKQVVVAFTMTQLLNVASQTGNESLRDLVIDLMVAGMTGDANFKNVVMGQMTGRGLNASNDVNRVLRIAEEISNLKESLTTIGISQSDVAISTTNGIISINLTQTVNTDTIQLTNVDMSALITFLNEFKDQLNAITTEFNMQPLALRVTLNGAPLNLQQSPQDAGVAAAMTDLAGSLLGLKSTDAVVVKGSLAKLNAIIDNLLARVDANGQVSNNDMQLVMYIKGKIDATLLANKQSSTNSRIESLNKQADTLSDELIQLYDQAARINANTQEARVAREQLESLTSRMERQMLQINKELEELDAQASRESAMIDLLAEQSKALEMKLAHHTIFNSAYNNQMMSEVDAKIKTYEDQLTRKLQATEVSEKLSAADIQAMEMYHFTVIEKLDARRQLIEQLMNHYKLELGISSPEFLAAQALHDQLTAKISQVKQTFANHVMQLAQYAENMGELADTAHVSQVEKAAQLNSIYRLIDATLDNMTDRLPADMVNNLKAAQKTIAQDLVAVMQSGKDMANSKMAEIKADLARLLDLVAPASGADIDSNKAAYFEALFGKGAVAKLGTLNEQLAKVLNDRIKANPNFVKEFEGKKLSERQDMLNQLIENLMANASTNEALAGMFDSLNAKLGADASTHVLHRVMSDIIHNVSQQETKQDVSAQDLYISVNNALQHELSISAVAWMNMLRVYNEMLSSLRQSSAIPDAMKNELADLQQQVESALTTESSLADSSLTHLISELGKVTPLSNRQDLEYEAQLLRGESADFIAALSGMVSSLDQYSPATTSTVKADMNMKQNLAKAGFVMNSYQAKLANSLGVDTVDAAVLEQNIRKDIQIVKDSTGKGGFRFEARTEDAKALANELNTVLASFEAARGFKLRQDQVAKMLEFVSNPLKGHEILTGGGKTSILMHMAALAGQIHGRSKGLIILSDENKLNEAYDAGVKKMYEDLGLKVAVVRDTNELDEAKLKELREADIIMTVMAVPGFLTRLSEQGNEYHEEAFKIMTNDVQIVNDEIHTVIGQSFILSQGEARKLDDTQVKAINSLGEFMDANAESLVALHYAALVAENVAQNESLRKDAVKRMREKAISEAKTEKARKQLQATPQKFTNDQIRDFILSEMLGDATSVAEQGAQLIVAKIQEFMNGKIGQQLKNKNAGETANQLYSMASQITTVDRLMQQAESDQVITNYKDTGDIAYVKGLDLLTIREKMDDNKEVSLKPVFNSYVNALYAQSVGASDVQEFTRDDQFKAQRAAYKSFATFVTQADGTHYGLSTDGTKIVPVSFGQLDENRKFSEGYEAGVKQLFGMRQQGLMPDLQLVEINDESIQGSYEEFLYAAIANRSGLITMTGTLGMVEPMHRALGVGVDRSVSVAAIVKYWGGYITEARAQLIARVLGITTQAVLDALGKDQFDEAAQLTEDTKIEGAANLRGVMNGSMKAKQNEHLVYVFHTQSTSTSDYYNEALSRLNEMRRREGDESRDVLIHVNKQWVQYKWNDKTDQYEVINDNVSEEYVKLRMLENAEKQSAVIVTHAGDVFGMDLKTNGQTRFVDVLDTQSDLTTVLQGFGRDRGYASEGKTAFNNRDVFVLGQYGEMHAGDLLEMVMRNEEKGVQKSLLETINRTKDFLVTNTITDMINRVKSELSNKSLSNAERQKLENLASMLTNLRTKFTSEQAIDDSISESTPDFAEDSIASGIERAMNWMKNAFSGAMGEQFQKDIGGDIFNAINGIGFSQELFGMLNNIIEMPKQLDAEGNIVRNEQNQPVLKQDLTREDILDIKVSTPKVEFRAENDFAKVDYKKHSLYGASSINELLASIAETIKRNELPLYALGGGGQRALMKQLEQIQERKAEADQVARAEDLADLDRAFAEVEQDVAQQVSDPAVVIGRMRDTGLIKGDMTNAEYQAMIEAVRARGSVDYEQLKNAITEELFNTRAYKMREQVRSSLQKITSDMDELQKLDAIVPVIEYILSDSPSFTAVIDSLTQAQQQGETVNVSEQLGELFNKMNDMYGLNVSIDTSVENGIRITIPGAQNVAVDLNIVNGTLNYVPQIQSYISAVLGSATNTGMNTNQLVNVLQQAQKLGVGLDLQLEGIGTNKMTIIERVEQGFIAVDESGNNYLISVGAQPYSDLQFYHAVAGKDLGLVITPQSVQMYDQLLARTPEVADVVDTAPVDDIALPRAAHDEQLTQPQSPWTRENIGKEFEQELDIYSDAAIFMNLVNTYNPADAMSDDLKSMMRDLSTKDTAYQQRFIVYMFDRLNMMDANVQNQLKSVMKRFVTELTIANVGREYTELQPIATLLYTQIADNIGVEFARDIRTQILISMLDDQLDSNLFSQNEFKEMLIDYLVDINDAESLSAVLKMLSDEFQGNDIMTELMNLSQSDLNEIAQQARDKERTKPFEIDDSMRKALRSSM